MACCNRNKKSNKKPMSFQSLMDSMQGWCTPEKAERLHNLIVSSNSQLTVELGVFSGRSLIAMAMGHKLKGSGMVIGVDAWAKQAALEGTNDKANDDWWAAQDLRKIHQDCIKDIFKNEVDDYCSVLKMTSQTFGLLLNDNTIDVIHADSNHSEEVTTREVELFFPKLKSGGYWIADDSNWQSVSKAISMLNERMTVIHDGGTYTIFQKK